MYGYLSVRNTSGSLCSADFEIAHERWPGTARSRAQVQHTLGAALLQSFSQEFRDGLIGICDIQDHLQPVDEFVAEELRKPFLFVNFEEPHVGNHLSVGFVRNRANPVDPSDVGKKPIHRFEAAVSPGRRDLSLTADRLILLLDDGLISENECVLLILRDFFLQLLRIQELMTLQAACIGPRDNRCRL